MPDGPLLLAARLVAFVALMLLTLVAALVVIVGQRGDDAPTAAPAPTTTVVTTEPMFDDASVVPPTADVPTSGPTTTEVTPPPPTAPAAPPTTEGGLNPDEVGPSVTYVQPPLPPDCPTATGATATFTWTGQGPTPGCLVVRAAQPLTVVNHSAVEISVSFVSATVLLGPNDEQQLGLAGTLADGTGVRYLWVTGHPEVVGIVNVVA